MFQRLVLTTATLVLFAFSNGTAFAACADEIQVQEARMTVKNAQEAETLKEAVRRLQEAKNLCNKGDARVNSVLNELKNLLDRMGR